MELLKLLHSLEVFRPRLPFKIVYVIIFENSLKR